MMRRTQAGTVVLLLLLWPALASAQQASGIAGVVTDASGGVRPRRQPRFPRTDSEPDVPRTCATRKSRASLSRGAPRWLRATCDTLPI